jgi:DNA polymerase
VYRYVEGDFHILLFAYAFDDEEVRVVDLACGEELPQEVRDAVFDPDIIKAAWNAQFERTCLSKFFGTRLSPDSWQCSMVWAASLSLPLKLKTAAEVLKTGEQKNDAGERLIKYFLRALQTDQKPMRAVHGTCRSMPRRLGAVQILLQTDVKTERDNPAQAGDTPSESIRVGFFITWTSASTTGRAERPTLVEQAITCDLMLSEEMSRKAYELTGLENPNSVSQLKAGWRSGESRLIPWAKKDVASHDPEIDKNVGSGSLDNAEH